MKAVWITAVCDIVNIAFLLIGDKILKAITFENTATLSSNMDINRFILYPSRTLLQKTFA